jgi:hypothetical protein
MAMKSIPGGNIGEADAALSSVQRARMGWTMSGITGNNVAYARLGITGNDLRNKDPGAILSKLSEAQGKLDPQIYASLLQQIGLPASTIAFLQQGKASVDKLLAQYEKDADGQEKLAKETEDLQKSMVTLQTTIMKELIPPLATIAKALNRLLGGGSDASAAPGEPTEPPSWRNGWNLFKVHRTGEGDARQRGGNGGIPFAGAVGSMLGGVGVRSGGAVGVSSGGDAGALGGKAATYAQAFLAAGFNKTLTAAILGNMQHESGFNPNVVGDGGKARGVLQWHPDRQANFRRMFGIDVARASPAQVAQFVKWELENNVSAQGLAKIMKAAHSGNAGLTAKLFDEHYERSRGLSRQQRANAAVGYARGMTVNQTNHYNIRSTDPKGAASEISQLQRRHAVAQADRGVAP